MELTKTELQDMYNSMSNQELADKLNISKPTLSKLLKDNNIKLKGSGNGYNKLKIRIV
jgi:DNA-binding CsgD family transcriptional regulator